MFNVYDFGFRNPLSEFFNKVIGWLSNNFFRRPNLNDFSITHDGDPITNSDCFIEIVRNENDGLLDFSLQERKFFTHLAAY